MLVAASSYHIIHIFHIQDSVKSLHHTDEVCTCVLVDIPPLRVVHYPSVDTKARDAGADVASVTAQMMKQEVRATAFKPGPHETRSWSMEANRIPAVTYDHANNGYFK